MADTCGWPATSSISKINFMYVHKMQTLKLICVQLCPLLVVSTLVFLLCESDVDSGLMPTIALLWIAMWYLHNVFKYWLPITWASTRVLSFEIMGPSVPPFHPTPRHPFSLFFPNPVLPPPYLTSSSSLDLSGSNLSPVCFNTPSPETNKGF